MSRVHNFSVRYSGANTKKDIFQSCLVHGVTIGEEVNLIADDDPMLWEHLEYFLKGFGDSYKFKLVTDGKTFGDISKLHELVVKIDTFEKKVAEKIGLKDLDQIIANTLRFRNTYSVPMVIRCVDFGQQTDSLRKWAEFFNMGFDLQPMTEELAKRYPTTKI